MKENNKEVRISYWARYLTTIVSVTLVLLIIGLMALIGVSADNEATRLKETLELSVVTTDSTTDAGAARLKETLDRQPYVNSTRLITKAEALRTWTEETGENLEELFGVNPLTPEIAITLKEAYTSPADIARIRTVISRMPDVEGVAVPDKELVEDMNRNIETFAWTLGGVALVLVVISFVLINNTVHLTIYSRRFTIHTMQLVGAENSFIRRPLMLQNMLTGVISGLIASGILALALAGAAGTPLEELTSLVPWEAAGIIFAGLIVSGAVICCLAAVMATTRYLHRDYDQLFK